MDSSKIINRIEQIKGESIMEITSASGGCVADSSFVRFASGELCFLKQGYCNGMFTCEANGLKELTKPGVIRVPEVLAVDNDFLLIEYIKQGVKSDGFFYQFGGQLAKLHRYAGSGYGFFEDNFIGANVQQNIAEGAERFSWSDFYFNKRLLVQFHLAEKKGYVDGRFRQLFLNIENSIVDILKDGADAPALLHGDLWGGNYVVDEQGHPVIIDPAVYYGHREADLAMTRLFGGFSSDFYKGYEAEFPLQAGHEYRLNIYLLYHVLNHLNLFGKGYFSQAIDLMSFYS